MECRGEPHHGERRVGVGEIKTRTAGAVAQTIRCESLLQSEPLEKSSESVCISEWKNVRAVMKERKRDREAPLDSSGSFHPRSLGLLSADGRSFADHLMQREVNFNTWSSGSVATSSDGFLLHIFFNVWPFAESSSFWPFLVVVTFAACYCCSLSLGWAILAIFQIKICFYHIDRSRFL